MTNQDLILWLEEELLLCENSMEFIDEMSSSEQRDWIHHKNCIEGLLKRMEVFI